MSGWTPGTTDRDDADPAPVREATKGQRRGPCVPCLAGEHLKCTGVACWRCPPEHHRQTKIMQGRC